MRRAAAPKGLVSLARALSKFGVCSRKEAARRIQEGRVRVGGQVVQSARRRINPRRDRITVDGQRVGEVVEPVVLALHKPAGLITSRLDPGGRHTIYSLLGGVGRWVFPVGRLDRDSAGLLLLTNDHRLGQRLTDPEQHVPKTYHVRVVRIPDAEALRALREGVALGDGTRTRPARVRVLGAARAGTAWLEIVLTEGKNRQVRRMCAAVGHEVRELTRVAVGGLGLGTLAPGEWRWLAPEEVAGMLGRGVIGSARASRRRST